MIVELATPPQGKLFGFDGGAGSLFGTQLLGLIVTVLTVGVCYPFALVLVERWRARHTILNGRRLQFYGSAWGLFGRWLLWLLLIVLTLGIYLFWVTPRLTRWKIEQTGYAQ